jgi:hypothetical protein
MSHKVKSQCLFLCSDNGSRPATDRPWQWTADIEPGLLACEGNERMSVTLERFYTVADWDWIPPGASFQVHKDFPELPPLTIYLPRGNPKLRFLAADIQRQLDQHKLLHGGLTVTWNEASNRFQFSNASGEDFELRFPDLATAAFLGFAKTLVFIGPYAINYSEVSEATIRPLPVDTVAVHLLGVNPVRGAHHCTNVAGSAVTPTTLLGVIRVTAQPYTLLEWENRTDAFQILLENRQLRSLTFAFTDWEDKPLTQLGRHYMTLRVDTWRLPSEGAQGSLQDALAVSRAIQADTRFLRSIEVAKQISAVLENNAIDED